jgi:hypothetical protein
MATEAETLTEGVNVTPRVKKSRIVKLPLRATDRPTVTVPVKVHVGVMVEL